MSSKYKLLIFKQIVSDTFEKIVTLFSKEENKEIFSDLVAQNDTLNFAIAFKRFIITATYEGENVMFKTKRIIHMEGLHAEYFDFPELDIIINISKEVRMHNSDADSDFTYLDDIPVADHYLRRLIYHIDAHLSI